MSEETAAEKDVSEVKEPEPEVMEKKGIKMLD